METAGTLRVNEIFHSIQGESTFVGRPCVFVRLTGCGLRCLWCDTEYAFYEGKERTPDDIIAEIQSYGTRLVEITGGEPLEQPAVFPFMSRLCDLGFEVMVETGGHVDVAPVDERVHRIIDIKCPGSGMDRRNRWQNIDHLRTHDELKFVIADRQDYEWACGIVRRFDLDARCEAVLFAPAFHMLDNITLAQWILEDRMPVRMQLQLHKYIWPPDKRGV